MPSIRSRLLAVPIAAVCALALAGCGGSSGGSPSTTTSGSASPIATASGPVPEVKGDFGAKPEVTIPEGDPADALVVKTLVEGDGEEVKSGDLLVADYVGMTWDDGKEFDSSFSRGVPAAFPIGVGQVIQGWDAGLVGQTVGSRVVLTIPPSLGYGDAGQSQAGISGDDTLVFVVDIRGTYHQGATSGAKTTPAGADLDGLPQVTGDAGSQPTIKVPDGLKPPKKDKVVVLDKGDGAKITAGSFVIINYEAVGWNNAALGSTWSDQRPQGVAVGVSTSSSPFDALVGMTVGTRVLMLIPPTDKSSDPKTDTAVAVVDIVDSIPPTS